MNGRVQSYISWVLTVGMVLSCLFFLRNATCQAVVFETHGSFCAAEQVSVPTPVSPDETHLFVSAKEVTIPITAALGPLLFTLFTLALVDLITKFFVRRMEETLVRHGPYRRQFLPCLMATHDF